jgi:hypothetical protein
MPSVGALTLVLYLPVAVGAREVALDAFVACAALALVACMLGRVAFALLRLPGRAGFDSIGILIAGVLVSNVLMLGLMNSLQIDAVFAFCILAVVASGAWFVTTSARGSVGSTPLTPVDWLAIGIVLAATILWTRGALGASAVAEATGVFPAWLDFFLHAAEITGLRHYADLAGTSPYLAGTPQPFYHRASYALPAAYAGLADARSLAVAMYLWLPLGLVLVGLAAYSTASLLWSRTAGLAAVVALMLLPDPSMLWPGNALLGYHWLMQVAPGSGYAIAAILPGLALIVQGIRTARRRDVAIGLASIGLAGLFRAHVALLGLAAAVPLALFAVAPSQPRGRLGLAAVAGVALVAVVLVFERIELAPHFLTAPNEVGRFLDTVHLMQSDYMSHYVAWSASAGDAGKPALGIVLLLVAAFGIFVPALALLAVPARLRCWDAVVPWLVLLAYVFVVAFVPTPAHGDASDFKHRPFVLVYAVLAVWIAGLASQAVRATRAVHPVAAVLAAVTLLAFGPLRWGRDLQASTAPEWGKVYTHVPTPAQLFEAAEFVRTRSLPSDVVAASDGDPLAVFVGISERPAYVARYELLNELGGQKGAEARARRARLDAVLDGTTPIEQFVLIANVSWLVTDATVPMLGTAPDPVFQRGGAVVFSLPR